MKTTSFTKYLVGSIVLVLSIAPFLAMNATAVPILTQADLGNFSFYYAASSGYVHNVTYSSPNASLLIASDVISSGKNTSIASHGHMDLSKTLTLASMTLFVTNDSDMLYFATTSTNAGSGAYINFTLPSAASAVSIPSSQSQPNMYNSNSLVTAFMDNTVYRMPVANGYVYYMSNSPSNISSDGKSITFENTSLGQGSTLLVATTPSADLKYPIDSQLNNGSLSAYPLSYNTATGDVSGKYISFNYDTSTGIITDYRNIYSDTTVFSKIYSYGDGYIGLNSVSPLFPTSEPIIAGSVFFSGNSTSVYKIHNAIATPGSFYTSNGTTVLQLATGLNASIFHPPIQGNQFKERYGANFSDYMNMGIGHFFDIGFAPTVVLISNSTFEGVLFVHNGNASVTGSTITVTTSEIAFSQFVAQNEYLNTSLHLRNQLHYALQNGKLGAVVTLWKNGTNGFNTTNYYNNSLQLMIQNAFSNKVQMQIESQQQKGANIAIFIPNSIIQNTTQLRIMLNNQTMVKLQSMDGVFNSTDSSQGQYYVTQTEGGSLVILHIPHFSTQNIEITGAEITPLNWAPFIYAAIIISVVVVAGIYSYIMLKKRNFQ